VALENEILSFAVEEEGQDPPSSGVKSNFGSEGERMGNFAAASITALDRS
jgi:hypothetical protein